MEPVLRHRQIAPAVAGGDQVLAGEPLSGDVGEDGVIGDLQRVDGAPVHTPEQMGGAYERMKSGNAATLEVLRDGLPVRLDVGAARR